MADVFLFFKPEKQYFQKTEMINFKLVTKLVKLSNWWIDLNYSSVWKFSKCKSKQYAMEFLIVSVKGITFTKIEFSVFDALNKSNNSSILFRSYTPI